MPKQIWIHKEKRTFAIRHSNANVILANGMYADVIPIEPFVVIESVGTTGLTAIHNDVFFKDYERLAIDQNDTIDEYITKTQERHENEYKRKDISN